MHHFEQRAGVMHCEDVSLERIADEVGTPTYVYSEATLTRHFDVMDAALAGVDHLVCYSVKASSNIAILQLLASLGSGFDIVSRGELARVVAAGGDPTKVVFSGVGKRSDEIAAALETGIACFNVETPGELERIDRVAANLGKRAPISLRVNPDVDPLTHPYIATGLRSSKFGVAMPEARSLYARAARSNNLRVVGIDCHIGSQITDVAPFIEALERVLELAWSLERDGIRLEHIDLGGGLGIRYDDEQPPHPDALGRMVTRIVADHGYSLLVEPGRVIVGNAGVLLTTVLDRKLNGDKRFVIVDAAMNDNIRPALYGAFHAIRPVREGEPRAIETVDVVGPVCESGDFLARDRPLAHVDPGERLVLMSAGAYGFSMSSNYNSRSRAAEILVSGDRYDVIREREPIEHLFDGEHLRALSPRKK